ncbi:MAG: hypothetical protein FJW77_11930 [Actinobacteria bacterium]|nr:hypothetical protein [Actinomycetota bacterium]
MAGSDSTVALVRRALEPGEQVVATGPCWVAVRRPRVPLLVQARRRSEAVVTDRRLVLVDRPGRSGRPRDVLLARRFDALGLAAEHHRGTLFQQHLRTPTGTVVVEWPVRRIALADRVATAVLAARPDPAPAGGRAAWWDDGAHA